VDKGMFGPVQQGPYRAGGFFAGNARAAWHMDCFGNTVTHVTQHQP